MTKGNFEFQDKIQTGPSMAENIKKDYEKIRKEGESWKDAQARASKMMKEDSKDLSKTVETELDKLSKLVRSQKSRAKLSGLSGTNIKRDSVRRAKPKGRRISKEGNVYYENRDNRTDRLAPNYPKNAPYLAEGGYLTDPNFGSFQNLLKLASF